MYSQASGLFYVTGQYFLHFGSLLIIEKLICNAKTAQKF